MTMRATDARRVLSSDLPMTDDEREQLRLCAHEPLHRFSDAEWRMVQRTLRRAGDAGLLYPQRYSAA